MDSLRVPSDPFRRLIDRWIREQTTELNLRADDDVSNLPMMSPMARLSTLVGNGDEELGRRTIHRVTVEQQSMQFDTADKIVVETYGPWLWHTDPELSEIYESVNLLRIDLSYPVNDAVRDQLSEMLLALYARLRSMKKVAKELGCSEASVKRLVGRTGVRV